MHCSFEFRPCDFFPSIHFGRVKGMFARKPYSLPEPVAMALAQICCYDKVLPAGAPTSPIVSNMLCAQMDAQLKEIARRHGCTFTRYADDISFSNKEGRFSPAVAEFDSSLGQWKVGDQVAKVVKDNLFAINPAKTRVRSEKGRLEVTGLTINKKLNVPRRLVRRVRSMLNAWKKYKLDGAQAEFAAKYDSKQRVNRPADFRQVLRGKIDFIGFVRGRDDSLFLKLLDQYAANDPGARIRRVTAGTNASGSVLAQAIWLLESEDEMFQATAFAVEGWGMLTAQHAVEVQMYASRPPFDYKKYKVRVVGQNRDTDVAQIEIEARIPVQLSLGNSDNLQQGDSIILLGFPHYRPGDSVHIDRGAITQTHVYFGVPHFIIQPTIVRGNSGGPILDGTNRVVGIAVKGLETAGRFSSQDELSSFVPISMVRDLKAGAPRSPAFG
jgi:S1-C subfamily serine protease